jgi:hypothetical protein
MTLYFEINQAIATSKNNKQGFAAIAHIPQVFCSYVLFGEI